VIKDPEVHSDSSIIIMYILAMYAEVQGIGSVNSIVSYEIDNYSKLILAF
jgi:hypothetical protein